MILLVTRTKNFIFSSIQSQLELLKHEIVQVGYDPDEIKQYKDRMELILLNGEEAEMDGLVTITDGDSAILIHIGTANRVFDHLAGIDALLFRFGFFFSLFLVVIHKKAVQHVADQRNDGYLDDHCSLLSIGEEAQAAWTAYEL